MTRPLFAKSLDDLAAQIERNAGNRAELDLIRAELRHRHSQAASALMARVDSLVGQLSGGSSLDPSAGTPGTITGKAGSLMGLQEEMARSWQDLPRLRLIQVQLERHQGAEAGRIKRMVAQHILEIEDETKPGVGPKDSVHDQPETKSVTEERRWTEEAVADLRRKLIDLGKRNPLVAFKHGGRATSHLRIVDERPDLLLAALEEGLLTFEPLPGEDDTPKDEQTPSFRIAYERARLTDEAFLAATEALGEDERDARPGQEAERALRAEVRRRLGLPPLDYGKTLDVNVLAKVHGFDPSFDLKASDDDDIAAHHDDDQIRVLLIRKELDKRLKAIWERYRSHARDTGLHTLFLVFGFVQWFEDDTSDVALHAPLLLLSVDLDRQVVRGRYEYTLRGHDEGLQVNVALAEKMRQHFALELPALREEEAAESYFIRVAAVLEKGHRLSLRRFATLAVLPFPRMVLWKDLDPTEWQEGAFAEHELLPGLLGARDIGGGVSMAETYDIDAAPWADKAPALIQPADASQHSALIDAVQGHSIAIEGPPGTGKSQTITNIIAAALDAGKRVLFVAEKQAALAVVASRLKAMGFGSLLLELHGENANRSDFYDSLRARLAMAVRSDADDLVISRQQLKRQRDLLRRYLALIATPLGALGRTAYWLAWREINLRSSIEQAATEHLSLRWKPLRPADLDRTTHAGHRSEIDNFAEALKAIDSPGSARGRTRWVLATHIGAFNQSSQLNAARDAANAAKALARAGQDIELALELSLPGPSDAAAPAMGQLTGLGDFGDLDETIARSALRHPEESRTLLAQQTRWRQLRAKLEEDVLDAALAEDVAITTLAQSIEAVARVPDTAQACTARAEAASQAVSLDRQTSSNRLILLRLLGLGDNVLVEDLSTITAVVDGLGNATPAVLALYDATLLDPLTEIAVDGERRTADALAKERAALVQEVKDDAFEAERDELNRLAGILVESSLLERIFGSSFRSARRAATALLNTYVNRDEAAEVLRRLARHKSRVETFRSRSPAEHIFPKVLWRGVDSDWQALESAVSALKLARERLSEIMSEQTLQTWLALGSSERAHATTLARQVRPLLSSALAIGVPPCTAAELTDALTSQQGRLAALRDALIQVRANPEAVLMRDGEHLADRLRMLRTTQADFDRLAAGDGFDWLVGIDAPLEPLARALNHCGQIDALAGPLDILGALRRCDMPCTALAGVIRNRGAYLTAHSEWMAARANFKEAAGTTPELVAEGASDWSTMGATLAALASDEDGARLAADLLRYRAALNDIGCAPFAQAALDGSAPVEQLSDLYELLVTRALLTDYLGGDGAELARLGSLSLDAARREFVRIDKDLHELEAKSIVAKRLRDRGERGKGYGPKRDWTDMALVESELSLKRPRTPIRDLTLRAGKALQALKPVWMMSPTSAAQYIRPDSLKFDLLVVDEASQMRPEFAVSAIMRGKQFIVVGDAKQLPPTDFFATSNDDGDGDGADDGMRVDTESILDLANHRFSRKRRLKWHYRSQHEGLIQFSNRQFYDRDLMVFPSPTIEDDVLGVKCEYVKGTYEASINQDEAQAVIEEAFRLMRTYPQYSLGIVTMNAKQTELVRNEFDRLILEAPEVRSYVEEYAGGIDEFFIKNLENVQGDERDIILISTVYGPSKEGVVAQRFGPMNREVGWRRLNVLVTRAKRSIRIFTSLQPNDIKVTETSSRGLVAFKAYLTYAHNGAQYDDAVGGEPDSDFELFVAEALRGAGYEVVYQVGVDGFRIDLGVRHPDYPIGFIAGIECDGSAYHSGLTVRDRDRIRQTVLEGMGWNIYRIWSTDWFADPHREIVKLLARLDLWREECAKRYQLRPQPAKPHSPASRATSVASAIPAVAGEAPRPEAADIEAAGPDSVHRPREPSGKEMRPLDDIRWFEASRGQSYTVWLEGNAGKWVFAGSVDVLSRANAATQIYGGALRVAKSEYEGWVETTDTYFKSNDIHAAVREVARRARDANPPEQ